MGITDFNRRKKIKGYFVDAFNIILCGFLYSFGTYFFIFPNRFAPGGIVGIVSMIESVTSAQYSSYFLFLLNIPLLILSFLFLSKEFAVKTTSVIILLSLTQYILGAIKFPQYSAIASLNIEGVEYQYTDFGLCIIAAVFGGVLSGLTLARMLRMQSSTGGTDIVAALLQKHDPQYNVSWVIFYLNVVVVGSSFFFYSYDFGLKKFVFSMSSLNPVLLSFIYIFISSKMCDMVLESGKKALKFEVITDYPEEIANELIDKLKHGVTVVPAKGMYMHSDKSLLICVIKRRQIAQFHKILRKYPDTFTYVASVSEVIGKFRN